ncbi:hypothetical protein QUA56_30710 [Microcoleus sp. N3A4]
MPDFALHYSVCDSDEKVYAQDAIADKGFNGWLSLVAILQSYL